MEWSSPILLITFAAVYVATFVPAWRLLSRLLAVSAAKTYSWKSVRFWVLFVTYRLIIIAPYAVYLIFGRNIPTTLNAIIVSIVVFGILLSLLRFMGGEILIRMLWWMYGFVYDGLNYFYPYRNLLALTFNALKITDGQTVLDLGCGTGNLSDLILRHHAVNLTGVDGSSSMLSRAKRKLRSKSLQSTPEVIEEDIITYLKSVKPATFDRIAMVNVVYAVTDRTTLWKECLRVLKPGGLIIATTSDRDGSKAIISEHRSHDSIWKLFVPNLLLVGVIDYFISELSRAGLFNFISKENLFLEIQGAGGRPIYLGRCYGGPVDGVNILFQIEA